MIRGPTVLWIKITIFLQNFFKSACENLNAISARSAVCFLQPIFHLSKKSSWPPLWLRFLYSHF